MSKTDKQPWYPPQPERFGPWIEFTGPYNKRPFDAPIPFYRLMADERENQQFLGPEMPPEDDFDPALWDSHVVAYCVKLTEDQKPEAAPATIEPIMSLRDQFACHAMSGLLAAGDFLKIQGAGMSYYTKACYRIADAMLAARQEK